MELTLEEIQYKKMTEKPVKPLILELAVPTIISMLVSAIYNTADTFFVSQIGTSASGAIGVVFSMMAIIQAGGFTLGMGAGSIISRALGVKDQERANRIGSSAFFAAILLGLLLAVFSHIFLEQLMRGLGATTTVLPYAKSYLKYILYGAPIMIASFVMNNILRAEGKAKFAMIGLGAGGVINIGLDPLFIFTFDMGIAGAAIATLISQLISFILLLAAFVRHKSVVQIGIRKISSKFNDYAEIVKTGMPSFCRQGFASISTILLNLQASVFGDPALSAMSIVSKIFMLIFCVGLGIGQGYQPVMGYNYSAKLWKRAKEAYQFTYITLTVTTLFLCTVTYVFAKQIFPFFIHDDEVIAIGTQALRFQSITIPFLMVNVICNMTFQSIGSKMKATLLSCCRQGFFFIPCALILPNVLGLIGVELIQPISDICTCLVSIYFALDFYKEIKKKNE